MRQLVPLIALCACGSGAAGEDPADAGTEPTVDAATTPDAAPAAPDLERLEWARWPMPDSPTDFCTDGATAGPCPIAKPAHVRAGRQLPRPRADLRHDHGGRGR